MFIHSFKYYKSRNPLPNLDNIIDVKDTIPECVRKTITNSVYCEPNNNLGLTSPETWEIFEFKSIPGLILIENPFTSEGQRYWILQCLKEYTKKPHKLNIDFENILQAKEDWWNQCFQKEYTINKNKLISKLRWATLGYHHNWDTKHYSESSKSLMPTELSSLTRYLANLTNFKNFNAEAAIVNFYRMNSTLAGHTDHSEYNVAAPLFSISFGQTAIFLIGGLKKEDPARAIYLRSGDILIMSGGSRLRYHGVPKILKTELSPWLYEEPSQDETWTKAEHYINEARINLNVRQVLQTGQTCL